MKKFPWKEMGIGCMLLVLLVFGRCAVTVGRSIYYGGRDWVEQILADPWFYIGMASAACSAICFLVLASQPKRQEENDEC